MAKAANHALTDDEQAALEARGAWVLQAAEPGWPAGSLRGLGVLPVRPRLAVVGARNADAYGLEIAARIAVEAAGRGVPIVSGGAFGVDIAAHRAVMDAQGETVVVLGSGLDRLKPSAHRRHFERAMAQGAVVSPFALGTAAAPWTYPNRNPWIAALAAGVIVVQAALRSGSLQSARHALSMGRPVWVVPGPMDHPLHAGCHALVAEGAQILTSVTAWTEALGVGAQALEQAGPIEPPFGQVLWAAATGEARPLNEVAKRAGLSIGEAMAMATELEMAGWLRTASGGRVVRSHPGR
jgi:DNA processing protein